MLTGVMADYKESEKLPAQLASALMAIEDSFLAALEAGKGVDQQRIRALHASVTATVTDWFLNRATLDTCLAAINSLNTITGIFDRAGAGAYVVGLVLSTQNLRSIVTRIQTIRRTAFIPVGYVLLDLLVGITLLLLIFAAFKNPIVQYLVVGALTLIYVYLLRLIRDLDNPFDYTPNGAAQGTAEIDSTPLVAYCQAVQRAQGASNPASAPPVA